MAAARKVRLLPTFTAWFVGCAVNNGEDVFTVKVATALVKLPSMLVTTTL